MDYAWAFIGGLLSFLSPCVLPLVPPYLAYIGGTTIDQIADEETADAAAARRVFYSSLFFVAGLSTVFVTLGATASYLGQTLLQNKLYFEYAAGAVIIVFGLHFLNVIRIPFLQREARFTPLPARCRSRLQRSAIGSARWRMRSASPSSPPMVEG